MVGFLTGIILGVRRRIKPLDPNHMPDMSSRSMRLLVDDDLMRVTSGWTIGSAKRLIGEFEIERRKGRTARLALVISFLSLVVAASSFAWTAARDMDDNQHGYSKPSVPEAAKTAPPAGS